MTTRSHELDGRVAVVTGASRGIGLAIARRFAAAGAHVAVVARSLDASSTFPGTLAETVRLIEDAGGKALPIRADITLAEDRGRLVEEVRAQLGRIDVLVNNAGTASYSPAADLSAEDYDYTMAQYFRAPFELSQRVIPGMPASGGGWILNIGSATARHPEGPPYTESARTLGLVLYASAKAALHRLTTGLAAELHEVGIAVNSLAPVAAVRTPSVEAAGVLSPDRPGVVEPVEFIAEAALALCAGDPRTLTGRVAYSSPLLTELGRTVRTLDAREVYSVQPVAR